MARIKPIDREFAEGEAQALLDGVQSKLGSVPNLIGTLANAPAALKGYLNFGDALAGGVLNAQTREAIALTVAGINSCDYCASAHTFVSKALKVDEDEIARRLGGHSQDPKLNAVLAFAKAVTEQRGFVGDEDLASARANGITDAELTEIVANVAANIFTNYFNHVAQTEIDFPPVTAKSLRAA